MSEHRVPMLGASWRRAEDPALSRDPKVRAVVGALAALPSPEPRPEFRAELRAQLVAIAPRIIAETADAPLVDIIPGKSTGQAAEGAAASRRPRHNDSALARLRGISFGRPLAVAASVLTAFVLLFGGAVWMSQKALPGDTLYGLKRASESWQLATASSDTDKARDYLKFAKTRADEARDLLSRATASASGLGLHAGGLSTHTANLIASTLASADHDVTSASALLGTQAVKSKSVSPLTIITSWAPGQLARLQDIAAAVPAGPLHDSAESSVRLVNAALHRAEMLAPKVGTGCLDSSNRDELGPLPTTACPSTGPGVTPAKTTKPSARPGSTTSRNPGTNGGATSSTGPTANGTTGAQGPGSPTSSSSPIISLPPLPTSSLPVSVDSCGLGATLGPIIIGVGVCSSP